MAPEYVSGLGWFRLAAEHGAETEAADMAWLRLHGVDPQDVQYGTDVTWTYPEPGWSVQVLLRNENGNHYKDPVTQDIARGFRTFLEQRDEAGRVIMPEGYEGWRPE